MKGTGLGLALVLKLVELHGGGVTLESELGRGSRFTVALPWAGAKDTPRPQVPVSRLKPRILLVDEYERYAEILTDLLTRRGYPVILGRSGEDCFQRALEIQPDVIVMDVPMPILSSIQVVKRIREDEQLKAVTIIGLTALAVNADREKCLQAGMDEYFTRPVRIDELQAAIEEHLRQRRAGSA